MTLPLKPFRAEHLHVETSGQDRRFCDSCGDVTRTLWGVIGDGEAIVAAFRIRWTAHHVAEHGAVFEVCIGPWGDGTDAEDRALVTLDYREDEDGNGQYMVIDACSTERTRLLAAKALRRDEVIGKPLAPQIFALVDAIFLQSFAVARRWECAPC